MSARRRILRCPKCGHRFEAENGNNLHPYCSVKKPKETEVVDGSILTETYDCLNQECRHPITVYWYEPKRVFYSV